MNKKISIFMIGLLALTLAACQAAAAATQSTTGQQQPGNGGFPSNSDMQTRIASDPQMATRIASGGGPGGPGGNAPGAGAATTPAATATAAPTDTPEPTATPESDAAIQAAKDFFAALEKGDFGAASKLVSAYSLMANKLTASDVVATLTQQSEAGTSWSNLTVSGTQALDDTTTLVHVNYTMSTKDAKTGNIVEATMDEEWPFRFEMNQWRYNWTNIIDFKTLGTAVKLSNGVTIKPLQLTRFSDKIRLTVLAQNGTNEAIVIGGGSNQVLGTFHFGDQSVDAVNNRIYLDAWRSYTNITIDVNGFYTSYPDSVELVKYKTTTAAAWFTFGLSD